MSVEKIESLRKRQNFANEDLIRLRARHDDVQARVEKKAAELKERYGVSNLKELRALASQKQAKQNELISRAEQSLSAGEAIIKQVKEELNSQQTGLIA